MSQPHLEHADAYSDNFDELTDPGQPGIAWWAHVGGFAAGLVMTPFFKSGEVPYFGPANPRGPWSR